MSRFNYGPKTKNNVKKEYKLNGRSSYKGRVPCSNPKHSYTIVLGLFYYCQPSSTVVDRSLHSIGVVGSNPDGVETFRLDESLDSVYEIAYRLEGPKC